MDGNGDTLSYIAQSDDINPPPATATSGGDQYTGLDEFGRVVDQNWFNSSGGTIDRYQYGYDADGNVLYSDNIVSASNSQLYTYDGLNRLSTYEVGTLNSGFASITSPTVDESWSLDALGNWNSKTTLAGTTDDTINSQNQITAIGGTSLTYDYNGNTLTDAADGTYVYDAWNRMTNAQIVSGSFGYSEAITYTADGMRATTYIGTFYDGGGGEPFSEPLSTSPQRYYYSASGQLLNSEVGTLHIGVGGGSITYGTQDQYIWGLMYVNDLVSRDDNSTSGSLGITGSGLGERLYATTDSNYDITALTSTSGAVDQRFTYDAYGTSSAFNASYGSISDTYDWLIGFQGGFIDPLTGFVHFDARDYDPATGRWMEQDPAGYVNGSNLYQFELSSPVDYVDPYGLDSSKTGSGKAKGSANASDTVTKTTKLPNGGTQETTTGPTGTTTVTTLSDGSKLTQVDNGRVTTTIYTDAHGNTFPPTTTTDGPYPSQPYHPNLFQYVLDCGTGFLGNLDRLRKFELPTVPGGNGDDNTK